MRQLKQIDVPFKTSSVLIKLLFTVYYIILVFQLKKFLNALTTRSSQLGKDVFTRQEMIQIHKAAGVAGDPNDLIEAMHIHSYLLLKGSNTYQLIAI